MPSTAAPIPPLPPTVQVTPVIPANPGKGSAELGTSQIDPLMDIGARRHLMPSVMDDPIGTHQQCVCPGGDVENACIDVWTNHTDRLCDACRKFCTETDENGVAHSLVDLYGTTIPVVASTIVWAPNAKHTRAHAFLEECRGCHASLEDHIRERVPGSMCRQAWGFKGDILVEAEPELKKCGTCVRLVAARETNE